MRVLTYFVGISVSFGILFKFFQIQNLMRKIRLYQNVDVEINVRHYAFFEGWWGINVAIVQPRLVIICQKPKDVVPTIEPIVFNGARAAGNMPEQMMRDIYLEFCVKQD